MDLAILKHNLLDIKEIKKNVMWSQEKQKVIWEGENSINGEGRKKDLSVTKDPMRKMKMRIGCDENDGITNFC